LSVIIKSGTDKNLVSLPWRFGCFCVGTVAILHNVGIARSTERVT